MKVHLSLNSVFGVMTMWLLGPMTITMFISGHWSLWGYFKGDGWPPTSKRKKRHGSPTTRSFVLVSLSHRITTLLRRVEMLRWKVWEHAKHIHQPSNFIHHKNAKLFFRMCPLTVYPVHTGYKGRAHGASVYSLDTPCTWASCLPCTQGWGWNSLDTPCTRGRVGSPLDTQCTRGPQAANGYILKGIKPPFSYLQT